MVNRKWIDRRNPIDRCQISVQTTVISNYNQMATEQIAQSRAIEIEMQCHYLASQGTAYYYYYHHIHMLNYYYAIMTRKAKNAKCS